MSAIPSELNWNQVLDPFASHFLPDQRAQGKSHFQAAFLFIPSKERRQALDDLYAFCRLVDDISDETSLGLSSEQRHQILDQIRSWCDQPKAIDHPYWDRFAETIQTYRISNASLVGIIEGCRYDISQEKPLTFESWDDLNAYVYGVACCVGEATLSVLGATNNGRSKDYALWMGRTLQYLNIMRDIDEDFQNRRLYIPLEYLRTLKVSPDVLSVGAPIAENLKGTVRRELFKRAQEFRAKAKPYSLQCLPAELMAAVYLFAATQYWVFGDLRRLGKWQKLRIVLGRAVSFLFQSKKRSSRETIPSPSSL